MSVSSTINGNKTIIKIEGRFDFNLQSEFRKSYEASPPKNAFVVDFSATNYMDSSALGMMLLLRDYAGENQSNIELVRCSPEIKGILEISNFGRLFKIL